MSRLADCFETLKVDNRAALAIYLVAGDPAQALTVPLMHQVVASGASIIELGVPFSDPEADGPVVQAGAERALANGTRLVDVLEMVRQFRQQDKVTPVVLMGYLNPIERMGYETFAAGCADVGVDGTITVNLPAEEAADLDRALIAKGVDPIYLLSPTTSLERARKICDASRGFIYYVSLKGVTGAGTLDVGEVDKRLQEFNAMTDLPICVGFGIKDAETAARIAEIAQGVVIGSAAVSIVGQLANQPAQIAGELGQWVASIRSAMD
ncbi:MAG: tryptophan synthase subunit alpha [Gammaproteobacteria bacterium]|nr:tryptophan synthase subunit alpha [Gammaproteobacteria bacterium]